MKVNTEGRGGEERQKAPRSAWEARRSRQGFLSSSWLPPVKTRWLSFQTSLPGVFPGTPAVRLSHRRYLPGVGDTRFSACSPIMYVLHMFHKGALIAHSLM